MRRRPRPHLTYANVMATLAVFIALGGTTMAAVIITDNSQVAKDTISGHKPPSGDRSNIIAGSINATDLANKAVTPAKIKPPEAWHEVGPGSPSQDLCADPSNTAVFCSVPPAWHNFGAPFATAAFYKDQLGIVHLKGLVSAPIALIDSTPQTAWIFRLPPAYAPENHRVFTSVGRNDNGQEIAQSRVDVQPDGLVVLEQDCQAAGVDCSADGEYVTLEGISFRPDE